MHGDSAEASVVRTYLDWLAELPWKKMSKDQLDIVKAKDVLDEDHYGLDEVKQRVIQEYVPGRQITLAHLIASPQHDIYIKLGLDDEATTAIGILTITPSEGVIIAADIATKAAAVGIGFLDRFGGSLLLTGDVASVEAALREVLRYFGSVLHYDLTELTRS
mgnify:CR=1 FL=1